MPANEIHKYWVKVAFSEEKCIKISPDGSNIISSGANYIGLLKYFFEAIKSHYQNIKPVFDYYFPDADSTHTAEYNIQEVGDRVSLYVGNFDKYKGFGIGIDLYQNQPKLIKMYLQEPNKSPLPYSEEVRQKLLSQKISVDNVFLWQYIKPFHDYSKNTPWTLKNVYTIIDDRLPIFKGVNKTPTKIFKSFSVIDNTVGYYEQYKHDQHDEEIISGLKNIPYRFDHGAVMNTNDTFEDAITKNIRSILSHIPKDATVLDVECGFSGLSECLKRLRPDVTVWGITKSSFEYNYGVKHGFQVIHSDIVTFKPEQQYDCLIFNESFFRIGFKWNDKRNLIEKCKRMAKKIIMIAIFDPEGDGKDLEDLECSHIGSNRTRTWFPYYGFFKLFHDWKFEHFEKIQYSNETFKENFNKLCTTVDIFKDNLHEKCCKTVLVVHRSDALVLRYHPLTCFKKVMQYVDSFEERKGFLKTNSAIVDTIGIQMGYFKHSNQRALHLATNIPTKTFYHEHELSELSLLKSWCAKNRENVRHYLEGKEEDVIHIGNKKKQDDKDNFSLDCLQGNVYGHYYFHKGPYDSNVASAQSNTNVRIILNLGNVLQVTISGNTMDASNGSVIAFDNSFEHRLVFDSLVMVVDVWNPVLDDNDKQIHKWLHGIVKW